MKLRVLILAICFAGSLSAEGLTFQPVDKNIDEEHTQLLQFFADLSKSPPKGYSSRELLASVSSAGPRGPKGGRGFSLSQAGDDPFKTNATLQAMTALGMIAAQSIGTASQAQQSANLNSYGSQLSTSSVPQLAQAGGLMQQEAGAINMGDQAAANSYASSLQSIAPINTTGLTPTGADASYAAAMSQIGQQALASAAQSFTSAAMSSLVSSLASYFASGSGTPGPGGAGGTGTSFWSTMMSSMAGNLAKGAVNGTNTPGSLAGQGSGIASVGGTMIGNQGATAAFGNQNGQVGAGIATGTLGAPLQAVTGAGGIGVSVGNGTASGGALPGALH